MSLSSDISNFIAALVLDKTEDIEYHREKISERLTDAHGGPPISIELSPILIKRMIDATEKTIKDAKREN